MNDTTRAATPIARVHAGMGVLDRNGKGIGTVSAIRTPDRALVAVSVDRSRRPVPSVAALFRGTAPNLPRPYADKLLRTGYLKVDRPGFLGGVVYVPADEIIDVVGTTVRLRNSRDQLVTAPS